MKAHHSLVLIGHASRDLYKWVHSRMLIACAVHTEVLNPVLILRKSLQGCNVDSVLGIKKVIQCCEISS